MKRNNANHSGNHGPGVAAFKSNCLASRRKTLARIAAAREGIVTEARQTLRAHERPLRLALNEADGLGRADDVSRSRISRPRNGEGASGGCLGPVTVLAAAPRALGAAGPTDGRRLLKTETTVKPELNYETDD
jgi:hypothetical protein